MPVIGVQLVFDQKCAGEKRFVSQRYMPRMSWSLYERHVNHKGFKSLGQGVHVLVYKNAKHKFNSLSVTNLFPLSQVPYM